MRNFIFTLVTHLSLATQVVSPLAGLMTAPANAFGSVGITQNVNNSIVLDTASAQPITVKAVPQPNFDTDVLAPLRAAQEAKARAMAAAKRTRVTARVVVAHMAATTDALTQLRLCESGSTYTRNSGNGYFGAYQYAIGSWGGYGGYARADLAPAEVQDAKAQADITANGWRAWPACARKIGAL